MNTSESFCRQHCLLSGWGRKDKEVSYPRFRPHVFNLKYNWALHVWKLTFIQEWQQKTRAFYFLKKSMLGSKNLFTQQSSLLCRGFLTSFCIVGNLFLSFHPTSKSSLSPNLSHAHVPSDRLSYFKLNQLRKDLKTVFKSARCFQKGSSRGVLSSQKFYAEILLQKLEENAGEHRGTEISTLIVKAFQSRHSIM